MGFYFVIHVIIGLCASSIQVTMKLAGNSPGQAPLWASGLWGTLSLSIASISVMGSIITTAIKFPIIWVLAAFGEILLGFIVAAFLPLGFRFLVAALSVPINIFILGAIWGFWYI